VIPQLRDWHERFSLAGLTIVAVHTPEFFWEKPYDQVLAAVRELRIPYAVVQDNEWANWKRYGVRGWPTAVLVDRRGVVRYRRVGEGAYRETEGVIQRLLLERG
jgi:hypothetical protein